MTIMFVKNVKVSQKGYKYSLRSNMTEIFTLSSIGVWRIKYTQAINICEPNGLV